MFQGLCKNIAGLSGQRGVSGAHEQFVIKVEAAEIEVAGAGVNHVVDDDELGVEDLRLVFVDFHAGAEQAAVEDAGGELGNGDIGFGGQDELDAVAVFGGVDDEVANGPGGQKIGGDNLDVA